MKTSSLSAREFGAVDFEATFEVENPNDFAVEIVETERILRLQDEPFRSQFSQARRTLAPNSVTSLKVRQTIHGGDIMKAVQGIPEDWEVPASCQLSVHAVHRGLDPNAWYMAEWQGSLPVMLPPSLEFVSLERESLSALQADLHLQLKLTNANGYPLQLRSLAVALTVNDVSFGRIEDDAVNRWIPAFTTAQVKISQAFRLTNRNRRIFDVLAHSTDYRVEVQGTALLAFDSPLSPLPIRMTARGTARP